MQKLSPSHANRLLCLIDTTKVDLFFSLVDYRNNYFTSNDPEKIIEFYNSFKNRDQLIQWMKERPKGVAIIHEVDGEKDIIVVIPTVDFNGKYAKECRENIFKGLHIVFVESGGIGDIYFNFAHNTNVGISKAMEYNPKWIVVSNDDMEKRDDSVELKRQLSKLDPAHISCVFTRRSKYHSIFFSINKYRFLYWVLFSKINSHKKDFFNIQSKFALNYGLVANTITEQSKLVQKLKYFLLNYIITKVVVDKIQIGASFVIISSSLLKSKEVLMLNGMLYDETFLNAHEDTDLSIRMFYDKSKIATINYKIGDLVGSSLGYNYLRQLRTIAGDIYFFEKHSKLLGDHRG